MVDPFRFLSRYALDLVFIGLPALGAVTCWLLELPVWMIVTCLVFLVIAIVSFLGDLGVFGSADSE